MHHFQNTLHSLWVLEWMCHNLHFLSYTAQIRLVGGSSQCSGRVEVYYKGQWGTVCDDEWEMPNADVVCRQLGCGHAITAPKSAHFGRGTGPIWLDNVECVGDEVALTHCMHPGFGANNCGHGEDAGTICLGKRPGSCLIYEWSYYLPTGIRWNCVGGCDKTKMYYLVQVLSRSPKSRWVLLQK